MGLTCMAANCAGSYCFFCDDEYQGNKIFDPINTIVFEKNEIFSEETTNILKEVENCLKESEEKRQIIADKFKVMLEYTGACVLFKPTLERALTTYIIYLIEQIISCAIKNKQEFNKEDFSLTNFISISKNPPFLELNQITLDNLKAKYGFDVNNLEYISKGKSSIIDFLSTFFNMAEIFNKQLNIISKFLNLNTLKDLKVIPKLNSSKDIIFFLVNYNSEIISGLTSVQNQLVNPRRIDLFFRIANDAAQNKVDDPKELVLRYSWGENCGSAKNWEQNIGYKKVQILKY